MIIVVPASRVAREGDIVDGQLVKSGETGVLTDNGAFVTTVDGITLGLPTREVAPGTRAAFSDSAFVNEAQVLVDNVVGASLVTGLPSDWHYLEPEL
jgi:hypothetical protein